MIRTIIRGPHPILTTKCRPFLFEQDEHVILDLKDTISAHQNARGLAAPLATSTSRHTFAPMAARSRVI